VSSPEQPPPPPRPESWFGRHRLALGLFATAALLAAGAISIGLSLDAAQPNPLLLEAAKAAGTLATGLLLGGVLKLAMDDQAESKRLRDDMEQRLEAVIGDMHANHDRLETARLLIAAHRSAKTYGERMRDVIDAHVVLLKIGHGPGMDVFASRPGGVERFEWLLAYLVALQNEYRVRYKQVSDLQRYDEEMNKQALSARVRALLADHDADGEAVPSMSHRAWDLLSSETDFPVLEDLCARHEQYERRFLDSCRVLTDMLERAKARSREVTVPPAGALPTDAQLRESIEAKAREIRARCETLARERDRAGLETATPARP
jgi:hypothetical protein